MKKSNKKAFTLVELIVVIAIIGILGVGLISMIVSSTNVFSVVSEGLETKMVTNSVMQLVTSKVRFAKDLAVMDEVEITDKTYEYLFSRNGRLYTQIADEITEVYPEDFYHGYDIEVVFHKASEATLQVSVIIKKDGVQQYEAQTGIGTQNTPKIMNHSTKKSNVIRYSLVSGV